MVRHSSFWVRRLLPGCLICLLCACSKEPPPPLSRDEIFRQRLELPALYLTAKTHKRVIAPMSKGMFVDADTGEICWPALACNNPDCPGRKAGEPFVFIEPDAGAYMKPDGSIGYDPARARAAAAERVLGPCPQCAKIRDPRTETDAQGKQYISWVQPYVLPETAERMEHLDEELHRRILFERRQPTLPAEGKSPSVDSPQPTPADPATRPDKARTTKG